jgi:hypothetical protein
MLKDLLDLMKLKLEAFYWTGSAVIDKSGRTPHPGIAIATARRDAFLISTQDAGGDARDAVADWNRIFPGWERGCTLLVFYPKFDRAFTWEQLVTSVEQEHKRMGKPMPSEETMRAWYANAKPRRLVWVPSVGMKRIPMRRFWRYWDARIDYQRPQACDCPSCRG